MTRPTRPLFWLSLAAIAIGAAGVSARAISNAFKPPVPPVIAVVDIQAVVNGLDERSARETDLDNKKTELQGNVNKLVDQLKGKQAEIDAMAAGPARVAALQELRKLAFQAEFERQYSEKFLTEMKTDILQELYDKISEACKQLALRNAYTMVLASDQGIKIPDGTYAEVSRAITLKRMLYVDPAHDVTQELITMMNNAYIAAGGKPAPPPQPAPPAATKPGAPAPAPAVKKNDK